jgi:carboxymethylenebutenolidase
VAATIPATTQQMKAAGKFYETAMYEGAAHGFMQSGARPDAPEADKKAWDAAWIKMKALRDQFK